MPHDRAAPRMPKLLDIQVVRVARCRGSLNKILWGSSRTRPATVASFKQEVARAKVSILAASNAKLCAKKGLLLQITQFALCSSKKKSPDPHCPAAQPQGHPP